MGASRILTISLLFLSTIASAEVKVWILVVGISDYQYLNDLSYADADAREFLAYAKESLGNRFVPDQVRLLLNEQATNSAIAVGLQWIVRNAREKDRVYIYFSGHGGYEELTASKLGFLHAYDSYDATYVNGGNIGLIWLEDVLRSLAQRDVNTFLILDACHSGKVAVDDHYFLNNSLATFIPKVNKVLSAQGMQGSLESTKWGGGHGVFTYYLLQGIMGHADDDPQDNLVSLFEMEKYLLNNVPRETNQSQMPMVITSDKKAYLFPAISSTEKRAATVTPAHLKVDSSRSGARFGLAGAAEHIIAYKSYLDHTDLFASGFEPVMAKYNSLRSTVSGEEEGMELIDYLITYVLDHSQTFINAFMGLDEGSTNELKKKKAEYVLANAATQALTLIANDHPSYATLESRRIFFESEIAHNDLHSNRDQNTPSNADIIQKLDYAISLEPASSYLPYQAGVLSYHAGNFAAAKKYLLGAGGSSPNWSFPEVVSGLVSFAQGNVDEAAGHYRKAARKKPLTSAPYLNLVDCFDYKAEQATSKIQKRIHTDSMIFYLNSAVPLSDTERKAEVHESLANAYEELYVDWNDKLYLQKAIIEYKKAVASSSNFNVQLCDVIANLSFRLGAEPDGYFFLAVSEAHAGKKEYLKNLERSLKLGFSEWEYVKLFPSKQQADASFKTLINQYRK